MPELKVPADMCHFTDTYSYEENYKTDSVSSRSSSPKSVSDTDFSLSESSESPEGSVISDLELESVTQQTSVCTQSIDPTKQKLNELPLQSLVHFHNDIVNV